ncbi:MAG TPA: hypothetical protein VN752_09735 [Solirubrobacterales bacterium]|nr:hypothetical protein [Solirubrobacterales bacterium]
MLSGSTKAVFPDPLAQSGRPSDSQRLGVQVVEQRPSLESHPRQRISVDEWLGVSDCTVAEQRGGLVEHDHVDLIGAERLGGDTSKFELQPKLGRLIQP